ncbi:phospholipase D-like domain-containing protein [Candidatus Laterigemmans baculatus]|uniref:phospholipase D-like domain-containing protein n=1 Tax=Candidatus Laterigemmans baculatus TaxID=2770505 RepID=UPI0013DD3DB7|nr:phosphatidylserine/phosphatidylglycerophosphate/cardiolipin synthase family protein [Candidatus Laterigemmans baculatus]
MTLRCRSAAGCLLQVARSLLFAGLWLAGVWLAAVPGSARADAFRVLPENRQALQSRIDLIQQAEREIVCVYYAVDTGRVPAAILALLRDAAQRGVRVRLLVDGLISRVPYELETYLISTGVEIRRYHPPRVLRPLWLNRRLHDKLLIVDGEQMIIGSRNLKDEHFGLNEVNYVDCDAYVRGSAAAHAQRYFEWLWQTPDVLPASPRDRWGLSTVDDLPILNGRSPQEDRATLVGRRGEHDAWSARWRAARTPDDFRRLLDLAVETLVVCHGVGLHTGYDWSRSEGWGMGGAVHGVAIAVLHDTDTQKCGFGIQQAMLELIAQAQRSIWIETPYPVFTPPILEALLAARERGVQVVLLTGSLSSTDRPATYAAYQNLKGTLLRAGVEIWEYLGTDHLHSKSMVIDDCIAVIGSYNFDPRSEYLNLEVSIAAYDPAAAAALKATIREELLQATPVEKARALPQTTRQPTDPYDSLQLAAERAKMELTRLFVPAFRWML